MNKYSLIGQIFSRESCLCIGLDPDPSKMPSHLPRTPEGVLTFNKAIIEATLPFAVAYKPNLAFYEAWGEHGWKLLKDTIALIPKDRFIIADAKRGDIGNTAAHYADAFFRDIGANAITLSPYMGTDTVEPFLAYKDKWSILLASTSNPSGADFQDLASQGAKIYEHVVIKFSPKSSDMHTMFVVGATKPKQLKHIRQLVPNHFFLIPGVGAQGGDLEEVFKAGANKEVGLIINVGRSILYASDGHDYAERAKEQAQTYQLEMARLIKKYCSKV